jgi:hypothetical protein
MAGGSMTDDPYAQVAAALALAATTVADKKDGGFLDQYRQLMVDSILAIIDSVDQLDEMERLNAQILTGLRS